MSTFGNCVGVAVIAGGIAFLVASSGTRHRTIAPALGVRHAASGTELGGRKTSFSFRPSTGLLIARTLDGLLERELQLSFVVDEIERPLEIARADRRAAKEAFAATIHFDIGGQDVRALFALRVDSATGELVAELTANPGQAFATPHAFGLRASLPSMGRSAFVSGTGEISDLSALGGRLLVVDAVPHPLGFVSTRGGLGVSATTEGDDPATPMRFVVTSPMQKLEGPAEATTDLRVALGTSSMSIWKNLYDTVRIPTARVRGVVTGTSERAQVFGLDAEGSPQVRLRADQDGRFEAEVPLTVVQWYAALDAARTSAPTNYVPGTGYDLRLDVSPGGEIRVHVVDGETGGPLTARLIVHGIDGTLDPTFGPDYRASGAGPIIDALRGDVLTPLPAGRYRVAATKGLEWSIDTKIVDVVPGHALAVTLAPRHVVPTPGAVGCDLHVHARPSFDTPVSSEDRALSLVSAGVDFAVPSEHNIVGDYAPSLETLDLTRELASVTGVEVTTFSPRFGHFGLFPYPPGPVPPYKGSNVNALFNSAHRGDPSRVLQVNHPRLPQGIGFFEMFQWNPASPAPPSRMRTDFDSLEVYNGYDASHPKRVDAVLHDYYALLNLGHRYAATGSSDSHRIQFQWAGYPRTLVSVGQAAAGDAGTPIDVLAVVAGVKRGHAVVTSGPIIELDVRGAHPGDEIEAAGDPVIAHVRVRAAPWVDVSSLQIVVGGKLAVTVPIPSRPTQLGPETGSRADVEQRTIRYDADVPVPIGEGSTWLLAIVRGERAMDDILPFMPVPPMAFTNPIWIARPGKPFAKPAPQRRTR